MATIRLALGDHWLILMGNLIIEEDGDETCCVSSGSFDASDGGNMGAKFGIGLRNFGGSRINIFHT